VHAHKLRLPNFYKVKLTGAQQTGFGRTPQQQQGRRAGQQAAAQLQADFFNCVRQGPFGKNETGKEKRQAIEQAASSCAPA
jgi:hypothetical protein